jgi:hypothetical protein
MKTSHRPHDTAIRVAMHALGWPGRVASDLRIAP